MHPFSGRACHENEEIKQERGKLGKQRGEAPTQEEGEENHQDEGRGESQDNSAVLAQKKNLSRLEKEEKGPKKEAFSF